MRHSDKIISNFVCPPHAGKDKQIRKLKNEIFSINHTWKDKFHELEMLRKKNKDLKEYYGEELSEIKSTMDRWKNIAQGQSHTKERIAELHNEIGMRDEIISRLEKSLANHTAENRR